MLLPHPTLWQIGFFKLTSHGLFFALGAEAAGIMLTRQAQKRGLDAAKVWPLLIRVFAAGLIGARVLFMILYPQAAGGWSQLFDIWHGGLVSYGGLLTGFLTALACVHQFPKAQRSAWYDIITVATLTGWGIGRIGNFLAGDSIGVISQFWSDTYQRIPIQLFESIACFALVYYLLTRQWRDGQVALIGAIGYFGSRFLIDSWRDENKYFVLHTSQWVSLLLLIILLCYARSRRYYSSNFI